MEVSGVCLDSVKYFWGNPWARSTRCLTGKISQLHAKVKTLTLCYQPDWPHFNPYKHQGAQTSPSPTNLLCCPWCLCRTGNLSQTDPNGWRKRNCAWQGTHYLILGVCNQFERNRNWPLLKAGWQNAQVVEGVDDGPHPWSRQRWLVIEARCQDWLSYVLAAM